MILNMPVTNGAITSAASPQNQSELCDFLKRKYNDNDISAPAGGTPESSSNYAEDTVMWKKRHIEVSSYDMPSVTSPFKQQQQQQTPPPEGFSQSHSAAITTPVSNSSDLSVGTGTFNIIANSSAFINDLFAYDANLLGSVTSSASLTDGVLCATEPIFTSPSTICVNTTNQFEEDNADNWQASDLLELDHRYNSSLQTEITQLNPTVSLKPHEEESMASLATNSNSSPTQTQHVHFVAPPNPPTPCGREQPNTSSQIVDAEADFEDKNLSWLLNFKFDEFPHLNPDISGGGSGGKSLKHQQSNGYGGATCSAVGYKTMSGSPSSNSSSSHGDRSKSPKSSNKTGKKFEELVMEVTSEMDGTEMTVAENVVIEDTSPQRAPKKPPFTYTELIEYALEDKGELTVSGIYQWISDRFPYYKSNDDRWKNSVRHNLSINPHFRKGHKAPQGAGHLWTISSGDSAENVLAWEHKKQRLDLFFKMESMNRERLAQHQQHLQQQAAAAAAADSQNQRKHLGCQQDQQCLYDEAAVAAAAIQQEMLQQQPSNSSSTAIQSQSSRSTKDILVQHTHTAHHSTAAGIPRTSEHSPHSHLQPTLHELPYNDLLSDDELRKTAGQILNGIHREVEVQSVNQSIISTYQDVLLENEDYLNPVHKDVAVSESGLRHAHTTMGNTSAQCSSTTPYYVTEIDPMELGIHMTSHPHPISHPQHHNANNQHQHQQLQQQQQQQQHHHHHHHHHNGHVTDPTTNSLNGEETDVVLFNDEFNLNYFTYNPATDIVA